jgi:hypothetical protein
MDRSDIRRRRRLRQIGFDTLRILDISSPPTTTRADRGRRHGTAGSPIYQTGDPIRQRQVQPLLNVLDLEIVDEVLTNPQKITRVPSAPLVDTKPSCREGGNVETGRVTPRASPSGMHQALLQSPSCIRFQVCTRHQEVEAMTAIRKWTF